ncbi:penicillin-binding protein [Alloscardovia theropitheci]|uniref:Penicillin-binding protein n=1 Tax=Alloscardovia theropitheci TaxID=2496842 RepID=A0A4R0R0D0_9BIFI|nr:transglycosylase domain-containing protein [Alloscardovia theropitheci]TCD54476.1 penicillin-binding protein [Alloscardovia theropitheci]
MSEENGKKTKRSAKRVFTLILSYLLFCVMGGVVASGVVMPAVVGAGAVTRAIQPQMSAGLEDVNFDLEDLPQQSRMYASDGTTLIATFYTQNRIIVPLKDISQVMQQAVVAREDRRFFQHGGVDPTGVLRAFVQTYISRGDTQGGSTLTQQYVKNILIDQATNSNDPIAAYHAREDTIARKIREMLLSVQLEKTYSKAEILQGYLNIAQFGSGVYGVETAARRYFNTTASKLTLGQAATIAAITKNPQAFDPTLHPEAAQEQRDIVLSLMLNQGYATQQQVDEAKAVSMQDMLNVQNVPVGCQTAGDAAYFCDYVVNKILSSAQFGETRADRTKLLYQGGLNITTTMDVTAQNVASQAVRNVIPEDDPSGLESILAAVKPGTGEVLALAQNRTYDAAADGSDPTHTAVNYAVDQEDGGAQGILPGSTFKPINLVSWMQNGHYANEMLPTSTSYANNSFPCNSTTAGVWRVQNATGGTVSPESPFQGILRSHNTTQASMAQRIGLCAIADTATSLGYHNAITSQSDIHDTLFAPMVIGSLNVAPLTMANVYATIAANGVKCDPIAISKVEKDGKEYEVPSANCAQAIPSNVAQTTAYVLNQSATRGLATSINLPNRKVYAKTGTAEDYFLSGAAFTNGVSVFGVAGNMESQIPLTGRTIKGVTRRQWYGEHIAGPMLRQFLNDYTSQANIPDDPNYGQADNTLMNGNGRSSSTSRSENRDSSSNQSNSNAQNQNSPARNDDEDEDE